jgi:hypothetical protein
MASEPTDELPFKPVIWLGSSRKAAELFGRECDVTGVTLQAGPEYLL